METIDSNLGDLQAMATFARVVETRNFTTAATSLGLSKSGVSKLVSRLEAALGTPLLHRTTRRLVVTEAGQALYERVAGLAATARAGVAAVAGLSSAPRGLLRVNAPVAFGERHIAPALPALIARYPGLTVDLALEDRLVDVIGEGWDVVVRIGPVVPSGLALRRLARDERVVVASPEYLARRGTPMTPRDLAAHDCLRYTASRRPDEWVFTIRSRSQVTRVSGTIATNSDAALRAALLAGHGLTQTPEVLVRDELRSGRLVTVLDRFRPRLDSEIHCLYPRSRPVSPKTKVFLELLVDRVAGQGG